MPTPTENLLAFIATGRTPQIAEYIRVDWDETHTSYYGTEAYHEAGGYIGIGVAIEPRIIPKSKNDPFFEYELNPDLRTDSITITFDDIDKDITEKFQTYSSGVSCTFVLYYPSQDGYAIDLTIETWHGQLSAPQVYGWKTVKAVATNGLRSRELIIPGRAKRKECTAQVFGGALPDVDSVRSSLCPYDKHLGGSQGQYRTGTTPFEDCPKTIDACVDRFGHRRFFGGFSLVASAVNSPYRGHPFLALSRGNASNNDPVRVMFGEVVFHNLQMLMWRIDSPPGTRDAWTYNLFEMCEGPVVRLGGFVINGLDYSTGTWPNQVQFRTGERGQSATSYATDVSNFSSTAHIAAKYGGDTVGIASDNFEPANLSATGSVRGFSEVCVYTAPLTKTREWSNNRVWCLLELYHNQKFGMGYSETMFDIDEWVTTADWTEEQVEFTATFVDGEEQTYISRRSQFNAVVEGKPVAEQVADICRAGAIAVPFEFEGLLTTVPFGVATGGELSAAPVFYDSGENVNICFDGTPMIELSQTPDTKVVNEVEVRFEESVNGFIERPITVEDRFQKLKAGRQLGPDYLLSVPKKFAATGVTTLTEVTRLAYRLLKFGEFDEGGTDNNIRLTITVPFEQALGIRRYDIIKVVSDLLDNFTLPSGSVADPTRYPVEYFRVLHLKKVSGNRCQITAQVYNQNSYENFEVTPGGGGVGGSDVVTVLDAGVGSVWGQYFNDGQQNGYAHYNDDPFFLENTGGRWEIRWKDLDPYVNRLMYYSSDNPDDPWDATWVAPGGAYGLAPPPTVVEGIVPSRPTQQITIGTPVYHSDTGLLEIPID